MNAPADRRRHPRGYPRTRTGQVLVLTCSTMLVMAVMLMVTFTMANAIHEKIRIQAFSDAQAYSMAVVEARAFNLIAFTNRGITAALVAEMSIHAWYAIAAHDVSLLAAAAGALGIALLLEIAACVASYGAQHGDHIVEIGIAIAKLMGDYFDYKDKFDDEEDKFNDAVEKFSDLIKKIHSDQKDLKSTNNIKSTQMLVLNELKKMCAPNAEFSMTLANGNADAYKKAFDTRTGSDLGDIMNEAAMDTRPQFDHEGTYFPWMADDNFQDGNLKYAAVAAAFDGLAGRHDIPAIPVTGMYNPKLIKDDADPDGIWLWAGATMTASIDDHTGAVHAGRSVYGALAPLMFKDMPGAMVTWGKVNTNNGDRNYKGATCDDDDQCFVNFNGDSDKKKDMNQPTVLAGATQDLRRMRNNKRGPWEINNEGRMTVKNGSVTWDFAFVPGRDGAAVSKAKVYFHQIGGRGWKAPPNFFDPFWRAKLHPFNDYDELQEAARKVMDNSGLHGAVEGQ